MKSAVITAIQEIRDMFPGSQIDEVADPQGGAHVTVHNIPLGDQYVPSTTWFCFSIGFQYPDASPYPHFIRSDIARVDGKKLGEGFQVGKKTPMDIAAIQVSRRSHHWNPEQDTAAIKLQRVIDWVIQQKGA